MCLVFLLANEFNLKYKDEGRNSKKSATKTVQNTYQKKKTKKLFSEFYCVIVVGSQRESALPAHKA